MLFKGIINILTEYILFIEYLNLNKKDDTSEYKKNYKFIVSPTSMLKTNFRKTLIY